MRRFLRYSPSGVVVLPMAALACSGAHVQSSMKLAVVVGWVAFGFAVVVTTLVWIRALQRGSASVLRAAAVVAVVLCVLHPAIWISAYDGDCGRHRASLSLVWALFHCGIGFVLLPSRSRE